LTGSLAPVTEAAVIGRKLSERHARGAIAPDRARGLLDEALGSQAASLVRVRAQDPRMIACLVARADEATVRLCRTLGFEVKRGGTGVFGLLGADAARLFPHLPAHQHAWLETPCAARETKVLLVAGGTALFSLETTGGKLVVTAVS
jgi:hypothetical protein